MSMPARALAILNEVSAAHDVLIHRLRSRERTRDVTRARQEAWARIHALGPFSLSQIGGWFDRDHTTVLYGIRAHEKRLAEGRA